MKPYWEVQSSLTLGNNFLFYNNHIVAPLALQRETIKKIHEGVTQSLSVQRRVAVCLWCLGTPIEYCTISSTLCNIVHDTCKDIVKVLLKESIKFPSGDDLKHVVDEFREYHIVDGCHIPICAPSEQHTDYYNRKG